MPSSSSSISNRSPTPSLSVSSNTLTVAVSPSTENNVSAAPATEDGATVVSTPVSPLFNASPDRSHALYEIVAVPGFSELSGTNRSRSSLSSNTALVSLTVPTLVHVLPPSTEYCQFPAPSSVVAVSAIPLLALAGDCVEVDRIELTVSPVGLKSVDRKGVSVSSSAGGFCEASPLEITLSV